MSRTLKNDSLNDDNLIFFPVVKSVTDVHIFKHYNNRYFFVLLF